MQIELNNLIPIPLAGTNQKDSGLWLNPNIQFLSSKINLVLSPSGRGKTSLVHFLYGIRKDFYGEILFDNLPISNFSFDKWIELRNSKLAIVFQDLKLFSEISPLENILLKNNLTNYKTKSQILQMADILGVESLLNRPTYTLSYGQQQRIAIIRALCQPFSWIILDEPFSHLDKANISIAMQLIQSETQSQNAGIILNLLHSEDCISHDKIINI